MLPIPSRDGDAALVVRTETCGYFRTGGREVGHRCFTRASNLNPFQQPKIIICSFQFARSKEPYVRSTPWNLVVIDEAHRLRNVYKPGNKVANSIKNAVSSFQKVLLTATPLQNSLLELYGLVSIVDEFAFGDLRSFRAQFSRMSGKADFDALKQRLRPVCQRTLRRQVLAYVPYTTRHAMVQEFFPSAAEQPLYELVSEYLKTDKLYALPASQRQLMTLILRKLLASSTYAISDTLLGLANKLEIAEADQQKAADVPEVLTDDFETLSEVQEEWIDDDEGSDVPDGTDDIKKQPDRLNTLSEALARSDTLGSWK
jgi:SNF2 family DNA or RNA helicase